MAWVKSSPISERNKLTNKSRTLSRESPQSSETGRFSKESSSLVDPEWEIIDPTPDVHVLFLQFDQRFFNGLLKCVEVRWSQRMTRCAGLCCYEGRGGLCSIRLSVPLLKLRPRRDMVETLLHEMIHAYLFVTRNNRDRDGHGEEFQKHMNRINEVAGTNITIYHGFHEEVKYYLVHWWRCDGPCRDSHPFYGWVKRSMNRAPGPSDYWWAEHSKNCHGKFIKVQEPNSSSKKMKADNDKNKGRILKRSVTGNHGMDITKFLTKGHKLSELTSTSGTACKPPVIPFQGAGVLLGSSGTPSIGMNLQRNLLRPGQLALNSRLLKDPGDARKKLLSSTNQSFTKSTESGKLQVESTSVLKALSHPHTSEISSTTSIVLPNSDSIPDGLVECPACLQLVLHNLIHKHLDKCLN